MHWMQDNRFPILSWTHIWMFQAKNLITHRVFISCVFLPQNLFVDGRGETFSSRIPAAVKSQKHQKRRGRVTYTIKVALNFWELFLASLQAIRCFRDVEAEPRYQIWDSNDSHNDVITWGDSFCSSFWLRSGYHCPRENSPEWTNCMHWDWVSSAYHRRTSHSVPSAAHPHTRSISLRLPRTQTHSGLLHHPHLPQWMITPRHEHSIPTNALLCLLVMVYLELKRPSPLDIQY